MFFIFAWLRENQNSTSFEQQVPLLFFGNRLKQQNSTQIFNVIFLDGYDRLSSQYINQLKGLGFNVVNFSRQFQRLAGELPGLTRFGAYEMFCFLRWRALAEYLKSENTRGQVFHIDGDVVFNAKPEEIANDVKGLTFVLQGCPAFVSITNRDWLDYYWEQLIKFHEDVEGYSSTAWNGRTGWEVSSRDKWAGSRFRRIISSDQDLLSHLIHVGGIIQDNPLNFTRHLALFYMENPLYFHSHAKIQLNKDSGLRFLSDGDSCYVNNKKIAFWHFQSDFMRYLNTARVLYRMYYPLQFPNHLEPSGLRRVVSALCKNAPRMSRREAYLCLEELASDKSHAALSFANIFNRHSYWKKGIFSNASSH